MDPVTDFVVKVKCTIFWLNRGLRIYLDMYVLDFQKSTSKHLSYLRTLLVQNPLFGGILGSKLLQSCKNYRCNKKSLFFQQNISHFDLEAMSDEAPQNISPTKT